MAEQTYASYREPDREVLVSRNSLFLKALAQAYPIAAHDIVRGRNRLAEAEREQNLAVMENQVERLISRVEYVIQPMTDLGGDQLALKTARAPTTPSGTIIEECCAKHGVSLAEMVSARRRKRIVHARQEAMYRLYEECTLSLPQIGRKLGGRDHTTVLHGCRAHADRTGAPPIVAVRRVAS